jgi:hypothetical protein
LKYFEKEKLNTLRAVDEKYVSTLDREDKTLDPIRKENLNLFEFNQYSESDEYNRHFNVIERAERNGYGYKRRKHDY